MDEADRARRARLVVERDALAELDDAVVRAREREREEALRIEHGQRRLGEAFLEDRDRDLGRFGAVRVPAHSVDGDHEQRVPVRKHVDSVLVLRPVAGQAQLCMLDVHDRSHGPSYPRFPPIPAARAGARPGPLL